MPLTYSQIRYRTADYEHKLARISICDERGGEHFVVVHDNAGAKAFRERRDEAIELIADHIEAGYDPGEVGHVGL